MPNKKEPPKVIYLQWLGADRDELTAEELQEPAEEKTWCTDKIFDTDLEYRLVEKANAPATPACTHDPNTCKVGFCDWPRCNQVAEAAPTADGLSDKLIESCFSPFFTIEGSAGICAVCKRYVPSLERIREKEFHNEECELSKNMPSAEAGQGREK